MNHISINSIKLYHIVHIDKLPPILNSGKSGRLICDSEAQKQVPSGTTIGMNVIKKRRMNELTLNSYPDLHVGDCVPFYFCPRSVMLYMFHRKNHPDIEYMGGQEPIVHLVFNMMNVIEWANQKDRRWAFTTSNAGSFYFDDYSNLCDIDKLDWAAINTRQWNNCKEAKQAEFLVEKSLSWKLVDEISVYSDEYHDKVEKILYNQRHRPQVRQPQITVKPEWYY
ncbi:MAG: DUF4433 domain-containing protein [Peptococcaceae bacterium]|jgi:hypothetical protein|nr:DUF4433 domain-containing protein [Peptococcaceae bacterium]